MAGCHGGVVLAAILSASVLAPIAPGHTADGSSIVTNGSSGAPACASCHGQKGEGLPADGYPRLSGLNAGYLVHQLNSFADSSRSSEVMSPVAKGLSPEERQAVAAYYASQSAPPAIDQAANSELAATRGRDLATIGVWANGLPACNQCHGPQGEGVGAGFPRLAGQSAKYIENQLTAFRSATRQNDALHLMTGIASKLDEADIKAVASYYAKLSITAGKKD
ncbi:cytochrome c [Rhodopseudomonas palustris]|uniref:Cytochrome c n=1 Tax=Rhodopseudomonas palustris TaxID=1076 RepID=A0A418V3X3_RHOPL|nr:cytochrome c [Rhodopseudomonas palustris]